MKDLHQRAGARGDTTGLTLVEVTISLAISAIAIGSIVSGYLFSAEQVDQAACSTAAELAARQRLEQTRAAKWDRLADPPLDEVVGSNFPVQVLKLSLPEARGRALFATNKVTISTASEDPPLKLIQVDCIWAASRGLFTNTLTSYRAPDQ